MLRLKREQRQLLADKLPDVANVAAGGLVFGQALSQERFSVDMAALGFATWLALMALALGYTRKEPQ